MHMYILRLLMERIQEYVSLSRFLKARLPSETSNKLNIEDPGLAKYVRWMNPSCATLKRDIQNLQKKEEHF